MEWRDEATLARFRIIPCEWCSSSTIPTQAAHVFTKGMGGGGRLDLNINCCALCTHCHAKHHAGHDPTPDKLVELIALREKTTPDNIRFAVRDLRRISKPADSYAALCEVLMRYWLQPPADPRREAARPIRKRRRASRGNE